MVVMAIIAILATAGLSAYTGYMKKARDTKRIADVNAINTIVMGMMSSTGKPPQTDLEVMNAVAAANNGKPLVDPLVTIKTDGTYDDDSTKKVCMDDTGESTKRCWYTYRLCDGGMGYAVWTLLESTSNLSLYTSDAISSNPANYPDNTLYEIGSCKTACDNTDVPTLGCPGNFDWALPRELSCIEVDNATGGCITSGGNLNNTD